MGARDAILAGIILGLGITGLADLWMRGVYQGLYRAVEHGEGLAPLYSFRGVRGEAVCLLVIVGLGFSVAVHWL